LDMLAELAEDQQSFDLAFSPGPQCLRQTSRRRDRQPD
jgi:hypothetical protein